MRGGIFVILISLGMVCGEYKNPRVKTEFGIHKGIWTETQRGRRVASYLGIPYAKPPIGNLRFQKPSPWTEQWRKLWDSTKYASPCLPFWGFEAGSEDCLYLNIFTPQVRYSRRGENETNYAVLVFLIGDLYGNNDNALYDSYYLLDQDVVLVTVNYRYGYLGFFTTGDTAAPGNYGLKDVLEALDWLRRNIVSFGGDPENVTLMGQGDGAGIAHLLALSTKSEGLFHKYITQSGAAQTTSSFRRLETARSMSLEYASWVNCNQSSSQEIVECMRNISAVVKKGVNEFPSVASWASYGPTNEPESDEAVITEHPKKLMKDGKMRDIPWLTGVVADEGFPLAYDIAENSTMCYGLAEHFEESVFVMGNYDQKSIVDIPSFIQDLAVFYFDGNLTVDCADGYAEMIGDMLVNWPVYESLNLQVNNMKSNVYFYNFAYNGTLTITFKYDESQRYGVCHGDEMNYFFPVLSNIFEDLLLNKTEDDIAVINIVTEMWANFAKTGVPSARWSPEWKSYQDGHGYMEFGERAKISMQNDFLKDRMIFWRNLTERQFIEDPEKLENTISRGAAAFAFGHIKDAYIFHNFISLSLILFIRAIFAR